MAFASRPSDRTFVVAERFPIPRRPAWSTCSSRNFSFLKWEILRIGPAVGLERPERLQNHPHRSVLIESDAGGSQNKGSGPRDELLFETYARCPDLLLVEDDHWVYTRRAVGGEVAGGRGHQKQRGDGQAKNGSIGRPYRIK